MKPIVKGKHVYIRYLVDDDFRFIYEIYNDSDELYLWSNIREGKTFTEFENNFREALRNTYRHFCIICESTTCRKIGFIYCYNTHSSDGYAYTTSYLIKEYRGLIFGAEAGLLYYSYLFRYFNYRKLYSEVYSYNAQSKKFLESAGFNVEGILKDHRYYMNSFHDLIIFSIYRDSFLVKYQYLLDNIVI